MFRLTRIASLLLGLLAVPAAAADVIPPQLVGVWVSKDVLLDSADRLVEGQAIYVRGDGLVVLNGRVAGEPPAEGQGMVARYDAANSTLRLRFGPNCKDLAMPFDPVANVLRSGAPLHRRYARLSADLVEYVERHRIGCR